MRTLLLASLALLTACGACPTPATTAASAANKAPFTILQLNDVYEVNPVGGEGGLARVATLRNQLAAEGPVLTLLAGDFLSPSAIGLAKVNGERLAGEQMVATFDAMGLDIVTFGNHEFDVKEPQLLKRLSESKFTWVSSNVTRADGSMFPKVVPNVLRTLGGVKVGIFGVTLGSNPKAWVKYDVDFQAVARREIATLKQAGAQVIIALTHLDLHDDMALAAAVPEIDLIIGGHEHENWRIERGADFTPVRKADANARTVFVHRITPREGQAQVDSELVRINDTFADEPTTAAEAKRWTDLAFASYEAEGLKPTRVITSAWSDFDGREASVRNGTTPLTEVIAQAMRVNGSDVSIYNGGSIRIDDVIPQGASITEYDVLRVLPFGGKVVTASWTGALLIKVLQKGQSSKGKGGWLLSDGIGGAPDAWTIGGKPVDPAATYRVTITDYLLGHTRDIPFLGRDSEGFSDPVDGDDLRTLFIKRLEKGQHPKS